MERKLPTETIYRIGNITYKVISKYSNKPNAMTLEENIKQIFFRIHRQKYVVLRMDKKHLIKGAFVHM